MYRYGAVKFLIPLGVGVAIHAALSLLERLIPAIGTGLDPFLRLVPVLVAVLMAARSLRRPDLFSASSAGAALAGLTGLLGTIVASLIWLPGGHVLPAVASVTGTSVLVGAFAGVLASQRARLRSAEPLPGHPAESYPEARQTL